MKRIVGIIPARMASSRFPGKPMAKILGMPMIGHVYLRSKLCELLDEVYVATCDQKIYEYVESIAGKTVMTADTHERASDRAAEAILKVDEETGQETDIVVMIQGDEPMIIPEMIEESVRPMLEDETVKITNLMGEIKSKEDHENPNIVKVVVGKDNNALYFSREPIPSRKKASGEIPMYKQVPIISFARDFLLKFIELKPTPLEIVESVDMFRILEHGYDLKMIFTRFETFGVDTAEDLNRVSVLMKDDKFMPRYATQG